MIRSERAPLPDDAVTWERDGREFVQFADDMYIYEYDEHDRLARVLIEDLPKPTGVNPAMERLAKEIRDANPEVTTE